MYAYIYTTQPVGAAVVCTEGIGVVAGDATAAVVADVGAAAVVVDPAPGGGAGTCHEITS
jgi:hypothetical protein